MIDKEKYVTQVFDTDKYESMRRLFLDFIDSAGDEVDEEAWKNKLTMLDELLAEVERLRRKLFEAEMWVHSDSYTFENPLLNRDVVKELISTLESEEE